MIAFVLSIGLGGYFVLTKVKLRFTPFDAADALYAWGSTKTKKYCESCLIVATIFISLALMCG